MIGIAFSFRFETLLKHGTIFIISTFFLGGLLTSLLPFLLKQSTITFFLLCVSISFLSLYGLHSKWKSINHSKLQESYLVQCFLDFLGEKISLTGFIDTGNHCIEPISGKAVHFISFKAVEEKLPIQFKEGLLNWNEINPYDLSMFPKEVQSKIRMVYLTTVQKETSKVLAFRFNKMLINGNVEKELIEQYIVFTKNDAKFPQNAQIILNVQTL